MQVEVLISDVLNKIAVNQVLRQDTLNKLDKALANLADGQDEAQLAREKQNFARAEITALREQLTQQNQYEAQLQAQLLTLQAMIPVTPSEPPPENPPEDQPVE
jgi:seryl-tRNA synthetase